MSGHSTFNQLILLAYGETEKGKESSMLAQVLCDDRKSEIFAEILQLKTKLDEDMKSPSKTSLNIILDHSRNTNRHELETFC